jgi:hypothetical protein
MIENICERGLASIPIAARLVFGRRMTTRRVDITLSPSLTAVALGESQKALQ